MSLTTWHQADRRINDMTACTTWQDCLTGNATYKFTLMTLKELTIRWRSILHLIGAAGTCYWLSTEFRTQCTQQHVSCMCCVDKSVKLLLQLRLQITISFSICIPTIQQHLYGCWLSMSWHSALPVPNFEQSCRPRYICANVYNFLQQTKSILLNVLSTAVGPSSKLLLGSLKKSRTDWFTSVS